MIPLEKPEPEELLHAGVKGMKWGVRKNRETSATAKFKKANPTGAQRDRAIQRARLNKATARTVTKQDRIDSLRFTRGEKAALGILALTGFATIPIAVVGGASVARRKQLERKL